MKKITKMGIILLSTVILLTNFNFTVYATINKFEEVEFTEEYKEWQKLSDEDKSKTIMPNIILIKDKSNLDYLEGLANIFRLTALLGNTYETKYSLKDKIAENLVVKNQQKTNSCWAFANLAALETNLALKDKNENKAVNVYDFSERHLVYATSREAFLNGVINEKGFNKEIAGGNYYIANAYLTNGEGAIKEEKMPFENNEDEININEIKNKEVVTKIIDSKFITGNTKSDITQKIKEHIKNYGGVSAGIHGANLISDYYNVSTGAIYANNKILAPLNHNVLIIGWDDNYSKDNFNEKHKPTSDGAWIIKNSWGEYMEYNTLELKEQIYEANKTYFNKNSINSAQEVSNDYIMQVLKNQGYSESQVIINDDVVKIEVGNKGFMYVSYEDVHILSLLYGIKKAAYSKDYDKIYQYDELGSNNAITYRGDSAYIANVFERDSSKKEVLNEIGINTLANMEKCTVYINPNSNSKKLSDLQKVELKEGDYENLVPGYNTIELKKPIELTGKSFVVVVRSEKTGTKVNVPLITANDNFWSKVQVKEGVSFVATEDGIQSNEWMDTTKIENVTPGNITIKALTSYVTEVPEEVKLTKVEIKTNPTKLEYIKDEENLDLTGGILKLTYSDQTTKEIPMTDKDVQVSGYDKTKEGAQTITITYQGFKQTFQVTVNKKTVQTPQEVKLEKVEIKTTPTKLEYIKDEENLDLTGGILKLTYSDKTTKEVLMTNKDVQVSGYDKTKEGTQTITITYQGFKQTFTVKVVKKPVKKETKISNYEKAKTNIVHSASYTYTNKNKKNYTVMTIKVSGIEFGDIDSKREFFYYISGEKGKKNIANSSWKKIEKMTKESNGTYTATINLDSRNMSNVLEISNSENIIVYIKEKSTLENSTLEATNEFTAVLDTKAEIYLDDQKQDNIGQVLDKNNKDTNKEENNKEDTDNTKANGTIPQTGEKITTIVIIAIMTGTMLFIFIKIRKMKDIK